MRLIPTSITQKTAPADPTGGMTLDALMARQKQLAQQTPEVPAQIASPWQGASLMANTFVNQLQQNAAANQEKAGRELLAQTIAGIDPLKGATPEQQATLMKVDPDTGYKFIADTMQARRDAAKQEHWVDIPSPPGGKPGEQWQQNQLTGEKQVRGGASGGVTINTGDTDAKMPDWAAKDAKFYSQALGNGMDLEDFEKTLTSSPEALKSFLPGSNFLNTPEYQQAAAAGDSWIMSVLRPESGAVIGEDEMARYRKTYLPQPGDGAATIAYKRSLRDSKQENMGLGIRSVAPKTYDLINSEMAAKRAKRDADRKKAGGNTDPNAQQPPPVVRPPPTVLQPGDPKRAAAEEEARQALAADAADTGKNQNAIKQRFRDTWGYDFPAGGQ